MAGTVKSLPSSLEEEIMGKERKLSAGSKLFDLVEKIENVVCGVTLTGILIVVIIQIVGRTIGRPMPWTEEGTRYLFLWMMWVALASGFTRVESARVTYFVSIMPKSLRKVCSLLYIVIDFATFLFILYFGGQVFNMQLMMNEMGAAIMIPMAIIGFCLPVAGILGMIGVVQSVLEYQHLVAVPGRDEQ